MILMKCIQLTWVQVGDINGSVFNVMEGLIYYSSNVQDIQTGRHFYES